MDSNSPRAAAHMFFKSSAKTTAAAEEHTDTHMFCRRTGKFNRSFHGGRLETAATTSAFSQLFEFSRQPFLKAGNTRTAAASPRQFLRQVAKTAASSSVVGWCKYLRHVFSFALSPPLSPTSSPTRHKVHLLLQTMMRDRRRRPGVNHQPLSRILFFRRPHSGTSYSCYYTAPSSQFSRVSNQSRDKNKSLL